MFARGARRAVESFIDALNAADWQSAANQLTSEVCFNDCLFESVRVRSQLLAFLSGLDDAGLGLQIELRAISKRGLLVLARATMQSNDQRFCGPFQLTFRMIRDKIHVIDSHRGADAASVVRLYGRQITRQSV